MKKKYEITWMQDLQLIPECVRFFIDNTEPIYISHGEVMDGRAMDIHHWDANLAEVLREDFTSCIPSKSQLWRNRLAIIKADGKIFAMALVEFQHESPNPYMVLHDLIVIKSKRNEEIGRDLLKWVEDAAAVDGIKQVFLESSARNERAHHFFKQFGYDVCSVVMNKRISGD